MHKNIKILYTQETIASGGVERRRLMVVKNLINKGYDFKFICTFQRNTYIKQELEELGVEIIELSKTFKPWNLASLVKLVKIIRSYKPDIIHGGVFEGCSMAAIGGVIARVPIRIIEETSDPISRKSRANKLMRFYGLITHKTIAVSPAAETYLLTKAHIPRQKVTLINNGVKAPRIVEKHEIEQIKRKLKISNKDFIIGSVGRLNDDNVKRYSDLIKTIPMLLNLAVPVKLILIGEGKELINYKKLTKKLNISDKVIFVGHQKDVDLYYSVMDVFSLVSSTEGFGLVLAEAMLNKLPVIGTNIGGIKYIIKHNVTGYLVEVGDIQKMTLYFKQLYEDETLRKQLGICGKKRAEKNYTEDIYISSLTKLYIKFLNNRF